MSEVFQTGHERNGTIMGTISTTWTDDRIALLKTLFERGRTCREMAYEIGVSRNAVIGKLARLNLTRGRAARALRAERRSGPAPQRPRGARQLQILLKTRFEEGEAAALRTAFAALPIPEGPGCSLLELGDDKCRWPIGDANAAEFLFCGNKPFGGSPYCAGHARMAYRVGTRRAAG
jgi:GcrA cell cycle regulator